MTLLVAAAATGFIIALHAYFAPLTGVTGSLGALVVIVVCAVLAAGAFVLETATARSTRIVLRVLILLAIVGTGFASLLLHQWWICAAMCLGIAGLILELVRPAGASPAVYP